MTREQAAAYIHAQSVCALAEIEGMKAANAEREHRGESLAYPETAFLDVPNSYGIHHNAICALYEDCAP